MIEQKIHLPFQLWCRKVASCWELYLLILPPIITMFIFHYIPLYGVQIAFKSFRSSQGIWGSEWTGLANITKFLTYPDFWNIIRNTLSLSLYSIAMFPLPVIFALMLNELNNLKFKKAIQLLTYAPHFISTVVVVSIITLLLDRSSGMLNNLRVLFGAERIPFMSVPGYFSTIYVLSGVWQSLGWNTIIYIAALASISTEMIEAARIDGASRFKIVWHVNIPTILPTIVTMLILTTGSILSVGFEKVYLMQNPLNLPASRIISTYVYEMGLVKTQYSFSTAIGLFNNIVNIIVIMIVNRLSKYVTKIGLW